MIRKLSGFDYYEPQTLEAACGLLRQYGPEASLLAGGTDLLVRNKQRKRVLKNVVNLKKIAPGLSYIRVKEGARVSIGALTTMAEIAASPIVREYFPALVEAAGRLGSPIIRNLATIGGNVANASPAGETLSPLLALDARMVCYGSQGKRVIGVDDFFTGPGRTALATGEILVEIELPIPNRNYVNLYQRFSPRKSQDLPIVNIAISLELTDYHCQHARIVLGAVAPTPIRAVKAEKILERTRLLPGTIEQAAAIAASEARPIDDIRASAEYRQALIKVLITRNLVSLSR